MRVLQSLRSMAGDWHVSWQHVFGVTRGYHLLKNVPMNIKWHFHVNSPGTKFSPLVVYKNVWKEKKKRSPSRTFDLYFRTWKIGDIFFVGSLVLWRRENQIKNRGEFQPTKIGKSAREVSFCFFFSFFLFFSFFFFFELFCFVFLFVLFCFLFLFFFFCFVLFFYT